ncbi:hypothetical protein [Luteolibacter sp. Populi]|uniref:hypothetical protein n=1 Tax=Luteolibacter sp. Populi TaxID=3230487 RepID=UPI0034674A50
MSEKVQDLKHRIRLVLDDDIGGAYRAAWIRAKAMDGVASVGIYVEGSDGNFRFYHRGRELSSLVYELWEESEMSDERWNEITFKAVFGDTELKFEDRRELSEEEFFDLASRDEWIVAHLGNVEVTYPD